MDTSTINSAIPSVPPPLGFQLEPSLGSGNSNGSVSAAASITPPPGFQLESSSMVPPTMTASTGAPAVGAAMPNVPPPPGFNLESSPVQLSNPTMQAGQPEGVMSKLSRLFSDSIPGRNLAELPVTLERLAAPPNAIEQMQPSSGKAIAEQLNAPNIALAATGLPIAKALYGAGLIGKTALVGIMTKFAAQGAQTAGTELGTASGLESAQDKGARNKEVTTPLGQFTKVISGMLLDPDAAASETAQQKEIDYHNMLGDLGIVQALTALAAPKIGAGLESSKVEPHGLVSSDIKRRLDDIPIEKMMADSYNDAHQYRTDVKVSPPEEGDSEQSLTPIKSDDGFQQFGSGVPVDSKLVEKPRPTLFSTHSGVEPNWEDIKKKVGIGQEDWTHQGVKVAMTDSGFKSTDTEVDAGQLKNRVINKLNPDSAESKMWKGLGIDEKFKAGEKTTPEKMARWMQENGPRVEVRKFGEGAMTPEAKEYNQLTHKFDTLGKDPHDSTLQWTPEQQADRQRMMELAKMDLQLGSNQSHWGGIVAPKSEKDMPGYTEIAVVRRGGKLVANQRDPQTGAPKDFREPEDFPSSHSFPPNTLGFVRGYMETDKATGEKTFHVIEAQHDLIDKDDNTDEYFIPHHPELGRFKKKGEAEVALSEYEPLTSHSYRLALKAAIAHAKAEGATRIAISDAETAMMTEGHDRVQESPNTRYIQIRKNGIWENVTAISANRPRLPELVEEYGVQYGKDNVRVITPEPTKEPEQSAGMRLHYDLTLPKIAEELTGDKGGGKRVDFGKHRMAFERPGYSEDFLSRNPEMRNPIRKDLIFRNSDSTPKTSVSARSYSIAKPSARLSAAEPLTTMGKLYSGVELPEPVQRAIKEAGKLILGGGFTDADKLPKKPLPSPKADKLTSLETTLEKVSDSTPIESRDIGRQQPGEKMTVSDKLSREVNEKLNLAAKADKLLMPVDAIFDRMDGSKGEYNGWLFKNVRQPIDEKFNYELQLRDSMLDPVNNLVQELKLSNPQAAERIGVYAQSIQDGGIKRMLKSGITQETIDKIKRTITPEEKKVYAAMRTFMDQSLPAVQSVMKELYGKEVKPVDNYFPMPRDYEVYKDEPEVIAKGEFDEHGTWRQLSGDYEPKGAKTEQGFTITRKPGAKTAVKINAYEIYQQHIRDVSHLLAMQKTLHSIGQTVRRGLFAQKYGDVGQELTLDWLNTIARQGKSGKQIAFLDSLRNRTSKSIIGFRLASQLVHSANVPLAWQRAGVINWSKGLSESLGDKGEKFLHDHFEETFERGGGEPSLVEASRNPHGGWVFGIQRAIDRANAQATVLGVYFKELEAKGLDSSQYDTLPYDREAGAKALVLARRAVASPLYKDLPPALARGGSLGKMFFQFQNTFLDQWSNIRHDLLTAGIKNWQPAYAAKMAVALATMMLIETGIKHGMKNAVLSAAGRQPEGDDKFYKKLEMDALRRVPGMGQLMSEVLYGETGIPTIDVATDAVKGGIKAATGKTDNTKEQGAVQAIASAAELAGVPGTSQAAEFLQDKLKGEPKAKGTRKKRYSIVQ